MAKIYYHPPEELPAGLCEALQPVAAWALRAVRDAYQSGYYAGKADGSREWREILARSSDGLPTS